VATLEVGRVCVKIAGREAGRYCVVLKKIDDNFFLITGPKELTGVKRRRCNIEHLEPTPHLLKISTEASDKEVIDAYKKAGILKEFGLKLPSPEVLKEAEKKVPAKVEIPKEEEKKAEKKEEKPKELKPEEKVEKKEKKPEEKKGITIKLKIPSLRGKKEEKKKEKKVAEKKVAKKTEEKPKEKKPEKSEKAKKK
jgi:large subunit ribosomal protein L14e